ncbi:MAG TPA: TlpA disulfide reductase family protein [Gemmatimonadales bacterium]|nr:TlpA disulfide reductase family protein [Gemmatimonadales bacterium]
MRFRGAVLLGVALAACQQPAPRGFTLLFLRASPAAHAGDLSWAPDLPGERVVAFDRQLHVTQTITPGIDQPVAVSFPCHRHMVVSEYMGQGIDFDSSSSGEWPGHFPASLFVSAGCWSAEVRSPYLIEPFAADTTRGVIILNNLDHPAPILIGEMPKAALPFLTGPENAGAVTLDSLGNVYFAPVARDEITRYTPGGVVRWTTKRGLYPKEAEPRFLPNRGREVPLLMARAGIALTLGPDGRLYALGADDSTAAKLRIDVVDTGTGAILATRHLGPSETAVALDAAGSLRTFDADSLLRGAGAGRRESFTPGFTLPSLAGDTIRLADYAGKVTLVNFWASWCDPCREEFPHMASLYGQFSRKDFGIAAISDDVDRAKMRAFVEKFRPPFPILVGGGRMKELYHYRGLPYSVLLDRQGRVVQRIFGFGGPREFQELAAAIAKEIAAP